MGPSTKLVLIKVLHTVVWAVLGSCVLLLPVAAHRGRFDQAAILIGLVMVETMVLAIHGGACPLTPLAARYTTDRRPNFDIYLPQLLARYNKHVFGSLFLMGLLYTLFRWWDRSAGA